MLWGSLFTAVPIIAIIVEVLFGPGWIASVEEGGGEGLSFRALGASRDYLHRPPKAATSLS